VRPLRPLALVLVLLGPATTAAAGPEQGDEDDEDDEDVAPMPEGAFVSPPRMAAPAPAVEMEYSFSDDLAGEMAPGGGATPGGTKDVNLLRALVDAGQFPRPQQVTPEGLFSEHDLPLIPPEPCDQLLCVHAEVSDANLVSDPRLHYLAQLGFSSAFAPEDLTRDPTEFVLVVDGSSSMAGRPLEVVRETIGTVLARLGPADHVTLIAFDRAPRLLVDAAAPGDIALLSGVAGLEAKGPSHLDAGLRAGVAVARRRMGAGRRARIMLFTDDRPTFGRDTPSAFVETARDAARLGIGLTTVGVGVHFDAALAREIAAIRGGNLLFFDDVERMRATFESDFDSLVTELAHDLMLVVDPAPGMRVGPVFGVPESAILRRDRGIELSVQTLFTSRRRGAIYFALDPVGRPNLPYTPARAGMDLGEVRLGYREVGGAARLSRVRLVTSRAATTSVGLTRGRLLVDEALAIQTAAERWHGVRDAAGARAILDPVAARLAASPDETLAEQRALVERLIGML
jgi:Ca-activated chloride channel family protein